MRWGGGEIIDKYIKIAELERIPDANINPRRHMCTRRSVGADLLNRQPWPMLLATVNWQDYISIIPGVRSGKPCIKGTRITVSDVLEYLASGMTEQTLLADFPELRREHIQAVLSFAAERERRLSALPAVS